MCGVLEMDVLDCTFCELYKDYPDFARIIDAHMGKDTWDCDKCCKLWDAQDDRAEEYHKLHPNARRNRRRHITVHHGISDPRERHRVYMRELSKLKRKDIYNDPS